MVRLKPGRLTTVQDARATLQTPIGAEFGVPPPYLFVP
jgi:hypothetical protein